MYKIITLICLAFSFPIMADELAQEAAELKMELQTFQEQVIDEIVTSPELTDAQKKHSLKLLKKIKRTIEKQKPSKLS